MKTSQEIVEYMESRIAALTRLLRELNLERDAEEIENILSEIQNIRDYAKGEDGFGSR